MRLLVPPGTPAGTTGGNLTMAADSGPLHPAAQGILHHPATAWVILLLSLQLTFVAWYVSDNSMRQRAQDRFQSQTTDIIAAIEQRMRAYETVLRGGVGLYDASVDVDRDEWRTYASGLQLEKYFPGIQGFGYSQVVPKAERARHEAKIRAEGFPDYVLRPPGERDPYTAIIYLEPFNTRNQRAFGYDMFSEATRRAAMERARDSGQPALSGRVKLVQETNTGVQHGVLMYLPHYRPGLPHDSVEARRAALLGFVYAPFRMHDLMHGILGANQGEVDFELFDGPQTTADSVLFQSQEGVLQTGASNFSVKFSSRSTIELAGRTWTLAVYARPGFLSQVEAGLPLLVAIGGILVNLLLFVIIVSISRQRQHAEALAREMTVDLRRSNADLEQFAYAASHDMRQPLRMVSSYLQLLETELEPVLTAENRQSLDYAIDGAQRMDQMLSALLDYSRTGHKGEAPAWLNSRSVIDEALRYLKPAIAEAQAEIRIEGNLPMIHAVRDDMVRLWQNLIGNAVKYRAPGRPPQIVISATERGGEQHFAVRDNGIGLIPGQETRLFKVFERLHSRSKYAGTGIGLALCRKIVEHHGGRIRAESAGENQGCTFIFTLPKADAAVAGKQEKTHD